MVEKDWLAEIKQKLQEIEQQAKKIEKFWEPGKVRPTRDVSADVGKQIGVILIHLRALLDELRAAGYHKKSSLDGRKFEFLRAADELLDNLLEIFPKFRNHVTGICHNIHGELIRTVVIETTCLAVLGVEGVLKREFSEEERQLIIEYSYTARYPEIKEFADFLPKLIHRIGDISNETLTEAAFEVQWMEVPESLKRIT